MEINEFIASLKKTHFSLSVENEKLVLKGDKTKVTKLETEAIKKNDFVINYIKENKNELIKHLSFSSEKNGFPGKSKDISSIYKLSGLQQGMLFHGLYHEESEAYIEQFSCDLKSVNLEIFKKSWDVVINQHSILRSAFYYDAFSVPVQCVFRKVDLPVIELNYCSLSCKEQAAAIAAYEAADRKKGFDFKSAPLMRLTLMQLSKDSYHMVWTSHHLLFDGWSLSILMEAFLSSYETLTEGKVLTERPEDKYEDYIRYIERINEEHEELYWRNYIGGIEQSTLLPFIETTTERTKGAGIYDTILLEIDTTTTEKVQSYSQQHRLTLNTIFQGIWAYLLHHYTGNKEVVFGVIVSGRPNDLSNVENRVGLYINTLPLYSSLNENSSITAFFQQLLQDQVASREYQHTPLQKIQQWTGVQGDLFDTLLVFENYPVSKVVSSKQWRLQVEHVKFYEQNNYPLSISISASEKIAIDFNYNASLIAKVYVNEIKEHFKYLLLHIIAKPAGKLKDLQLLTPKQEQQLLKNFNNTLADYPKEKTIISLFEEWVSATPLATALVFEEQQLTYRQLHERSNRFAHFLQAKGVKAEMLVPICIERGVGMMVGLLGILKAGGTYVPIDPDYPADRITYMLKDTAATIVVSSRKSKCKLPGNEGLEIIELDSDLLELDQYSIDNVQRIVEPNQLAYVIYTSGSTGKPKGVMIEHRSIVNLLVSIAGEVCFKQNSSFLSVTTYSFDICYLEFYIPLVNGGKLIIVPREVSIDGFRLTAAVSHFSPTHMQATPSTWQLLLNAGWQNEERMRVLIGGEAVKETIKEDLTAIADVWNVYGPTETTIWSTIEQLKPGKKVVIGKPISNTSIYILNSQTHLVPVGVAGQLCIAGAGLARGYFNQQLLTAEKFIPNPFNKKDGEQLYLTGDVARWLPDGTIEYLGRIDDQVKIRGCRIELGEIEGVLLQSGLVKQAVVVAREVQNDKSLVGYVVIEKEFEQQTVIDFLRSKLPDYMIPAFWVQLERLPLTLNGKIDRKSLPSFDLNELLIKKFVAPRTTAEMKLAAIWQKVLNVQTVGVRDNFFELGGHSVLAMQLVSALRKQLQVELSIKDLFLHPTIETLAGDIESKTTKLLLPPIKIQPRPLYIPLSFSQERLWFIDKLEGSVQYHLPVILKLEGLLDMEALSYSLKAIIHRHEVLRTTFKDKDGQGYQYINDADQWALSFINGAVFTNDKDVQKCITAEIAKPFDLSKDYMLRATLINQDKASCILVATIHHIASDGWSLSIIVKEVQELYNSYLESRSAKLPLLPVQYADYAIWQREYLQGELLDKKVTYWKEKLRGVSPLQLLQSVRNPLVSQSAGAAVAFEIDKELLHKLNDLSKQQGTTLFMTLLAAFKVLLYRYTGQEDICIGTSIANRPHQETEGLIGFFINLLVLRSNVKANTSFAQLLDIVKTTTIEAYDHQDLPYEKVVDAVVKERKGQNPLVPVLFVLQSTPAIEDLKLNKLNLSREAYTHTTAQFDINFTIKETNNGLQGLLEYRIGLYNHETIASLLGHYKNLLFSIVQSPQQSIDQQSMLSKAEERQLLFEFNQTKSVGYNYNKDTVVTLFEEQVAKGPQSIAVVFGDRQITYEQLNASANQLAHYLRTLGVKAETLVPVCVDRSIDMLISILGILKSRAAYVPIDPAYPIERISFLLEDTAATIIITTKLITKFLNADRLEIIEIDNSESPVFNEPVSNPANPAAAANLAYVIYTSGSTGKPKGVMIDHSALLNYLLNNKAKYITEEKETSGSFVHLSYTFDASLTAIFMPLLAGKLIVVSSKQAVNIFEDENLPLFAPYDFIKLTPAHIPLLQHKMLLEDGRLLTNKLVVGGEALQAGHFDYFIKEGINVEIINEYGPTEATVGCSVYSLYTGRGKENLENGISIGKPIDNVQIFILSQSNQVVPIGVAGEICIGGAGLARGYLNKPGLTAEKFVSISFTDQPALRLYKTGDLAKWLPNGNIAYLGRKDDQVKIRGYRVELGEIESLLNESELISQALVVAQKDKSGNNRLIAYVVCKEAFDKDAIEAYARIKLPDYMVPAIWIKMESFPLTNNGKIDKLSLPDADATASVSSEMVAPGNDIELQLATIWKDLLEIDEVGIHDDFFDLGGHSLLAIRVISAIRKQLEVELAINEVFDYPTIEKLAQQVLAKSKGALVPGIIAVQPRPAFIPLSFSQERLWFIDQLEGSQQYHVPAVLRFTGNLNKAALSFALRSVVNRHEVLRTVIKNQNDIPYQVIKDIDEWQLTAIDGFVYKRDKNGLKKLIEGLITEPFNLQQDYMLRAALISVDEQAHLLVVTMHHIASDGWSSPIIIKEVAALYNAYDAGRDAALPALPIQYADFAIWQRNYLQGEILEKKLGYWINKLNKVSPLILPTDHTRAAVTNQKGNSINFSIDKQLSESLVRMSQQEGTTLFMTLLAVFKVLLYRYTAQEDITVGTPIAGRQQQEVEGLVGFFINMLALRTGVKGDVSFTELLRQVRTTTLEAFEHQEVPFEKVVEAVVRERDINRNPLFQVMFDFQNIPNAPQVSFGEVEVLNETFQQKTSKLDITFTLRNTADGLKGTIEYFTDLYNEDTICRMAGHYTQLLQAIVGEPGQRISALQMLTIDEQQKLLFSNKTSIKQSKDKTIVSLFESQASRSSDSIAVVFEDEKISYGQLNARSNQLAHYLRKKGVKQETLVPVCLERSVEMIIGIMGILKAGGVCVPIDPEFPLDRISYIIEDTAAFVVVSSRLSNSKIPIVSGVEVIEIDRANVVLQSQSPRNPTATVAPYNLAYIIYTSGSTGRPKGVMVEHRNVVSISAAWKEAYELETFEIRLLQLASISFDVFFGDLCRSLLAGGKMVICPTEIKYNLEALYNIIAKEEITIFESTPALILPLMKYMKEKQLQLNSLKVLILGSDILYAQDYNRLRELYSAKFRIINSYGTTETTIDSLYFEGEIKDDQLNRPMPIGKPYSNTDVYIVNESNQVQPLGIPGELGIGGDGVSRGYLNMPNLTLKKFINNHFDTEKISKIYRTGDLVRSLPDGNIEFLGRMDDQVKIRGYRIELEEVVSVILESGLVTQAVVIAVDASFGNKQLVGYIVAQGQFNKQQLTLYLQSKLPLYMVPSLWVEMDILPLSANGKVDKKALPVLDILELLHDEYVAPANETELALAVIWQQLLKIEKVGVNDNFFEAGGHSLLAMRLISLIRKQMNVELAIKDLFIHPTIAALSAFLSGKDKGLLLPSIAVANPKPNYIPLSFSQERLWFIDQLEGSTHYHIPTVLRLKGMLNINALDHALKTMVARHEVLRTVFLEQEDQLHQQVKNYEQWQLEKIDGSRYQEDSEGLQIYIKQLINQPFDLSDDFMLRTSIIKLSEDENILVVNMHHITSDAWSASISIKEVAELYNAYVEERPAQFSLLSIQYSDYAIWQRNYLKGEVLEKKLSYWKEKLEGVEQLQLPTDYQRPTVQTNEGAIKSFHISHQLTAQLKMLSDQQGTTMFMTLLAGFKVLLYKYSSQSDICVGTPIANRKQQELQELIGFFVNTLSLRSEVKGDETFTGFLQQVKTTILQAFENQDVPFEKVVEAVSKERDISRSALFQVMFVFQHVGELVDLKLNQLDISIEAHDHVTAKFDLTFFITETPNGLNTIIEYNTGLYTEQTISRMFDHFCELLSSIVKAPKQKVAYLPMLSKAEEHQLLIAFNNTKTGYLKDKSIVDLFEEQALNTPDKPAVTFEEEVLLFKELNVRSNQLAHLLRAKGVKQDCLVPICVERSTDMIVGVLAILKAGGAYVPLDPEYPQERLSYMLEDVGSCIILTSKKSKAKLSISSAVEVIEIDGQWEEISKQPNQNLQKVTGPENLVYVLYTSGSTGRPKGVKMPAGGMMNLLNWQQKQFQNKSRNVLQFASLNFDVSFQEIFSTICFGSTLFLINEDRRRDVAEVVKDMEKHAITHLFIPYVFFNHLAEEINAQQKNKLFLEEVIVAGEQLKLTKEIEQFLKTTGVRLTNQYGPTEAHVVSSYPVSLNANSTVFPPIGKPIDNTTLYILDQYKQPVPVSVPGELYIGGVQVASGYLNQPELTEQKFTKDLFSKEESGRLYKTGDLSKWLPDGNIAYLGRIDEQVKIRGYRIELGEIESVLQQSDLVKEVVVIAKEDNNGNRRLVSYVVPEGLFEKEALIVFAKSLLPDYMVPSLWVEMENIPVTKNGKVDKKALLQINTTELLQIDYIAPINSTQKAVGEVWQQLLNIEKVGLHDNFFELGGHSLLATRVASAIRKRLQVDISIKELFIYPTIATLADLIDSKSKGLQLPPIIPVQPRPDDIQLSFSQERLWFIDKLEGSVPYHISTVLELTGQLNYDALHDAFKVIVNRHEILRTIYIARDGEAYQKIKDEDQWQFEVNDGLMFKGDERALDSYIIEQINKPFNLSYDDVLRVSLIKLGELKYVLVVVMHHIASDGWSLPVIVREVSELYNSTIEGRTAQLPTLPLQYADYSIWQRKCFKGELLNKKLGYWKKQLQGVEPLQLPSDYPRLQHLGRKGAVINFEINKELADGLNELSRQHGVTLFMSLLAVLKVLLYRYTGQNDVCIGTPVAGRQQHELEGLVGVFINTLALRDKVDGELLFTDFLRLVFQTTIDAYEHQEVPFAQVVDAVVKQRGMSNNPLFDVMLILQNTPAIEALRLGDVQLSSRKIKQDTSRFEITLSVTEAKDCLSGSIEYNTGLFNSSTIERLIKHFKELITSVVSEPRQRIAALPMLAEAEKHQLLLSFNDTSVAYPSDKTIVALFEEQVLNTPDNIAVVYEDSQLTYGQLNERSNQLAHYLRSRGVVQETLVPICIERGIEMIVCILGILKAGGAYVPIDPEYPAERIVYMLEDTAATIVITSNQSKEKLPALQAVEIVSIDENAAAIGRESSINLPSINTPASLAYVIYTSGSTGKPKGVMIAHKNVYSFIHWCRSEFSSSDFEVVYASTSVCFDLSVFEIFFPLSIGKKIRIIENGLQISQYLPKDINVLLNTVPVVVDTLLKEGVDMSNISLINMAGEPIPLQVKDALNLERIEVRNLYGPTEDTTYSTCYRLRREQGILIGKPISNTSIYILDSAGELVPAGVVGEICIGGSGVARGYLNRPELTAEKFITNEFSEDQEERLYKTGDLGRWLPDGNIAYVGRIDDQVKIRGYRIELGEIESVLIKSGLVKQAVVVAKEDKEGSKRLVAYVVAHEGFNKEVVIAHLHKNLPHYMVPALWVELESIPINANGKIDKKALPNPDNEETKKNYVEPHTEIEKKLAIIWAKFLSYERVGIDDDFFELGGHSLLAMRVIHAIAEEFKVELPVKDLFEYSSIRQLGKFLELQLKGLAEVKNEEEFDLISI